MADNIRVPGYVEKVVFNGNIEYRNFSPDLVGVQLTSDGGTPLFTMGNFSITTNMDPKLNKTFSTNGFSQFYSLSGLNLNVQQTQVILDNTTGTTLNLDKTKLKNYALFGSLVEFTRVSLEDIITTWPASIFVNSLYVDSIGTTHVADTFENYSYDVVTNIASFRINTTLITNNFGINYLMNGTIADSFNETNDLRNITANYASYVIPVNDIEYDVIGFTGSTEQTNDFIYLQVKGNVFSGLSSIFQYHIRPNNLLIDTFFKSLDDYQSYLLNRQSYPLYTATFKYSKRSDSGIIIYTEKSVTWPVADGYNIDFQTGDYLSYATDLLTIAIDSDSTETNLMVRFLVSESITSFDTIPVHLDEQHMDTSGQKVTKLLTLYGREYDEINKFIQGISFAHSVSYDKVDNTPDKYLKDLAKVLGWDLISSVTENDLLRNFVSTKPSEYSGHSRSLTPVEADVELWRRLILNSPWLWKSKGARKSVEFLLKFIGTPQGLVEFNEYVYKAEAPIDIDVLRNILFLSGLDTDIDKYPIDTEGFPRFFPDTNEMYFQNQGKWYRETGGSGSTLDLLHGNNPHVGPYDGGFKYIDQLSALIPNFTAITVTAETITSGSTNLFTNYNLGKITNYNGELFVSATTLEGNTLPTCVVITTDIIPDPKGSDLINDCGCETGLRDDSLRITIDKAEIPANKIIPPKPICSDIFSKEVDFKELFVFLKYQYNQDGSVFQINGQNAYERTFFTEKECCTGFGGFPNYMDDYQYVDNVKNKVVSGYVCCDGNRSELWTTCNWYLNPQPVIISNASFCEFTTLFGNGIKKVTTARGHFCPKDWTVKVANITDPNTGDVGFGCMLTQYGLNNLPALVANFKNRADSFRCTTVDFPIVEVLIAYIAFDTFILFGDSLYFPSYSKERIKAAYGAGSQTGNSYWTTEPIKVGTVFYKQLQVVNKGGVATELNGNYLFDLKFVTPTATNHAGLVKANQYIVGFSQGVVQSITNFNQIL